MHVRCFVYTNDQHMCQPVLSSASSSYPAILCFPAPVVIASFFTTREMAMLTRVHTGTRYPHILNHISVYTIPSIDEVLDLYHESQSSTDHVPSKPSVSPPHRAQHKEDNQSIVASIARAYAGTNGPEVIGPGSQLYNVSNAHSSSLPPNLSTDSLASSSPHAKPTIYRKDSWDSGSESDDSVYLSTILEEPEPPEMEANTDIVKPVFRARRQRDILGTSELKAKMRQSGYP